MQGHKIRTHRIISPSAGLQHYRLFGHVSYSRLYDCIDRVMKHRIEQLELDVCLDSGFTLPPCLFNCNTLRVLTLNHQKTEPVQIDRRPLFDLELSYSHFNYLTSTGLSSVHTLSLTNVYFKHGSDLFCGDKFPLLRNLWLKNCRGMIDLKINCPGLETLKLEDLELKDLGISGVRLLELRVKICYLYADSSAKILAPILASSLQCLYWENKANVEFTEESFRDINTGFLFFCIKTPDAATLNRASKVLSALCFSRSLSVGSQVLEILSSIYSEGGLRYSFNNLRTLELHTDLTKDEVTGIIRFLSCSPILHTVTMGVSCSMIGNETLDDDWYWSSQSQNLKSIERHLKVARIDVHGTKMSKSVVYLVKFLLRCETALREMTLTVESDPADPPVVQQTIRS